MDSYSTVCCARACTCVVCRLWANGTAGASASASKVAFSNSIRLWPHRTLIHVCRQCAVYVVCTDGVLLTRTASCLPRTQARSLADALKGVTAKLTTIRSDDARSIRHLVEPTVPFGATPAAGLQAPGHVAPYCAGASLTLRRVLSAVHCRDGMSMSNSTRRSRGWSQSPLPQLSLALEQHIWTACSWHSCHMLSRCASNHPLARTEHSMHCRLLSTRCSRALLAHAEPSLGMRTKV